MAPTPTSLDVLRHRVEKVMAGTVEGAYDSEFARALAMVILDGHKSEVLQVYQRLQDRFKREFAVSVLKQKVTECLDSLRIAAAPEPVTGWERGLLRKGGRDGEDGNAAPCEMNALMYFRNHPEFKGRLGWNSFTNEFAVRADIPAIGIKVGELLGDHHDVLLQVWFQGETSEPGWSVEVIRRAVDVWAKGNTFHPIKEYLESLPPWDGIERLPDWLTRYCGAGPAEGDDAPEALKLAAFIAAIGERWMISAVARIYQPGCEVHHVLVLEGAKGLGKSTLVRNLFGEWTGSINGDVASKDSQQIVVSGIWCLELDELGILNKSGMNAVKSWVTRPFETFRPSYGHRVEKHLRQVVFLATVDRENWADEPDRRWWPVACRNQFDLDGLKADRGLLWAEALHKYRAGQRWHLDAAIDGDLIATAKLEQASRVPEDAWHGLVLEAVEKAKQIRTYGRRRGWWCSCEEIIDHLRIPHGNDRDKASNRVGRAMRGVKGWERVQVGADDGTRPWMYYSVPRED